MNISKNVKSKLDKQTIKAIGIESGLSSEIYEAFKMYDSLRYNLEVLQLLTDIDINYSKSLETSKEELDNMYESEYDDAVSDHKGEIETLEDRINELEDEVYNLENMLKGIEDAK